MSEPDELLRLLQARDGVLLARLRAGDPAAVGHVSRLLRMTPLALLRRRVDALVEVLALLPETHESLRHAWWAQDRRFTVQLFAWVERRRRVHAAA